MKTGALYTIIFMFVISIVFTGSLAVTNKLSEDKIIKNRELEDKKAILTSLGIEYENNIEDVFTENISETDINGTHVYLKIDQNKSVEAFVAGISGPGLWGTIKGYISVSADLKRLIGIEFTEQNETPGLGGRISEEWYKIQFKGLEITSGSTVQYGNEIDAITGATLTSNAVLKIINSFIADKIPELEAYK